MDEVIFNSPGASGQAALRALDTRVGHTRRAGSKRKADAAPSSPLAVIERISAGLPGASVRLAQERLGLTYRDIARVLDREEKTIRQWALRKTLSSIASEQVFRLLKVYFTTCAVLEDEDEARAWLREPSEPLGGRTPLGLLATAEGERLVINELMQIEYAHPV